MTVRCLNLLIWLNSSIEIAAVLSLMDFSQNESIRPIESSDSSFILMLIVF